MLALVVASAVVTAASSTSRPWAEIATTDIARMATLLKENHPGPVDPENPNYAKGFEGNRASALERAKRAENFFDYKRAVLSFTNTFRDGHTAVIFLVDTTGYRWPGFSARADDRGVIRISEADRDLPVKVGDEIVSCDGISIDQLLSERTDPYYWNADIPHERPAQIGKLFAVETGDEASQFATCRIKSGGTDKDISLTWRSLSSEDADRLRVKHVYEGEPRLTKVGDLWWVKLPSFMFQTAPQVAQARRLLSNMKAHRRELQSGKVVLDVRGNAGGSSAWAAEVASLLWGEPLVTRVEASFDWTHDWRASPANLKRIDETLARFERDGLTEQAAEYRRIRDIVAEALGRGKPLARIDNPPAVFAAPPAKSSFTGRAYLLTDGVCASACLNFADIVRRMPNATHIGWPTSADTVYIDNTLVTLPSGLAMFGYSMKVYRNGVRSNNQWYDPQIRWPGGLVTDKSLAAWIGGLK